MARLTARLILISSSVGLALLLSSCGSGGGGGGADDNPAAAPAPLVDAVGSVAVLFTDGPSDDFDQINVTVTSIEFLGGDSPVAIFQGEQTIDLLQLESFSDVFALSDDVPAGTYEKIRLHISDLELLRLDDLGDVLESIHPRLPANGKIDLNPRQTFAVMSGELLVIEIDMDADKSIHIVQTGNGNYIFRPVIFVEIVDALMPGKLVRLQGDIAEINADAGTLLVCSMAIVSSDDDSDTDDFDADDCTLVQVLDDTGIFGVDGFAVDFDALMPGDRITVIGHIADNTDEDARLILEAAVIEVGPPGTFDRLSGTVLTSFDSATDSFQLQLDSQQGFEPGTAVTVLVQERTRLFDREGQPLDTDAIEPDVAALVDGVITLSDTEPDTLRAALIVLDTLQDVSEQLSGTILSVDIGAQSLILATDTGDRCVDVSDNTDIFVITSSGDGSNSEKIELSELPGGSAADVYGLEGINGCFVAETILAFPQ